MDYIVIISFIMISVCMSIFMMFGRQTAIDLFLSIINYFTAFFLITYFIEGLSLQNFGGSLLMVGGILCFIIIISFAFMRVKSYKMKGNSNIEG